MLLADLTAGTAPRLVLTPFWPERVLFLNRLLLVIDAKMTGVAGRGGSRL